jgi:cytochrome c peroxidase
MDPKRRLPILLISIGLAISITACSSIIQTRWDDEELSTLRSLWIGSLPTLSADPSNQYADDPAAAALGQDLFFDTRFSSNGEVACGTCHLPGIHFQDGTPLANGMGTTNRRTMTIVGTAYSPWLFWDGRKDSQWAQALGPLENEVEHGGNRTMYAHLIAKYYAADYEDLFGPLPNLSDLPPSAGPVTDPQAATNWDAMAAEDQEAVTRIYVNIGKSIAAYERLMMPGESRFDQYVEAILNGDRQSARSILTADEIAGLKLFIGEAHCINCHNGPLFTNNAFHNTGIPISKDLPDDTGRSNGVKQVLDDEFNCLSKYSDARPDQCGELNFLVAEGEALIRQFKPPSLRNVVDRGPYMHAGQFTTLQEVLQHYNTAPESPAGHNELEPLNLSEEQLAQIIAFLKTLDAPLNVEAQWLAIPDYDQ